MKNYLPHKTKYFKSFSNYLYKKLMALRYGIQSNVEGYDYTLDQLDWMRFQIIGWQENEDNNALTQTAINYVTWLAVTYDENDHQAHTHGPGYLNNQHQYQPQNLGLNYNFGDGNTQNIIEVNAGGCLTRINLNPSIVINGNAKFEYVQYEPSAEWLIVHNLGFTPNVSSMDTENREIEGVVEPVDNNTIKILFSEPIAGIAYLS
jgi:hypothetical protein